MGENIPESINKDEKGGFDEKVVQLVTDTLSLMKSALDFELTNFEYLKLFHIAREVVINEESAIDDALKLADEGKFTKDDLSGLRSHSFGRMEVMSRFFLKEYGIHPLEFHSENYADVTESFKKYLKILQKKHADGDDEQSQLTHDSK